MMTSWLPIDTAPKDGTRILIVEADGSMAIVRAVRDCWTTDCWDDGGSDCELEPTHWMPLPSPPFPESAREQWIPRIAAFLERAVRWGTAPGDYVGRDRILEVFNADVDEQLDLLRRFREIRPDVEAAAGGPVVVIFHTRRHES